MLQRGADPTALTATKSTPIHLAAYTGDLDTVQALLEGSAVDKRIALSMINNDGQRPVDIAQKQRHENVADYLRNEAASIDEAEQNDD